MAAAHSTSGAVGDVSGGTTRDSPSITLPAGSVAYIYTVCSDFTPQNVSGVVWDPGVANQACTLISTQRSVGSFHRTSVWRLINGTAKTSTFRATWAASVAERIVSVWVGAGIDTTTPNGTVAENSSTTGTALTTGAITTTAGQLVLAFGSFIDISGNGATFNSPSGTERVDYNLPGGPITAYDGVASQDQTAAGSSTNPSWTLSAARDGWAMFGLALNDAPVEYIAPQFPYAVDPAYLAAYDASPYRFDWAQNVAVFAPVAHAASGALASDAATISGSAGHTVAGATHATSGALASDAAVVAGAAVHLTLHTSTGALAADASVVSGAAVHPHTTSGALSAQASSIAGAAAAEFVAAGALSSDAATIAGAAVHTAAGVHSTTGAIAASDATITGTAEVEHVAVVSLGGRDKTRLWRTYQWRSVETRGALQAGPASMGGTAMRVPAVRTVRHVAYGSLASGQASMSGDAQWLSKYVEVNGLLRTRSLALARQEKSTETRLETLERQMRALQRREGKP